MTTNLPYGNTTLKILWKMWNGQMPCLFQEMTGLYCPGCGGTRAVKALIKGDLVTSFLYHPIVLYCALVILLFACSYVIYGITKKKRFHLKFDNRYVYIGIVILAVNFLVKNYLLIVEETDVLCRLSLG